MIMQGIYYILLLMEIIKKIDKLWNVVVSYQKAQSSGVDSGLKYLNEIDSSYKNMID